MPNMKPEPLRKTCSLPVLVLAASLGANDPVLADDTTATPRLTFGTTAGPTDETTHSGVAQHANGGRCETVANGYVILHHTANLWPDPGIDSDLPAVFSCKVNFSDYVLVTETISFPRTACVRAIAWSRANKPTHRGHVNCKFDSLIGIASEFP